MSVNSGVCGAQGAAMSALILGAGGPLAGVFLVQWVGPFDPGEYMAPGGIYFQNVHHGASFSVTAAQAAQLAASDPNWWAIVG